MKTGMNVLLVGLGLIGGSLAMAMKKSNAHVWITAMDTDTHALTQAKKVNMIDAQISTLQQPQVAEQDVIIFCTPVRQTEAYVAELSTCQLKPSVIITDVGSTKCNIMKKAKGLTERGYTFIGGHPMAGSHKSGFVAADARLFENAYYILTCADEENTEAITILTQLLEGTQAKFEVMSAEEHDQIVAMVSHLPHIIASGLVTQNEKFARKSPMSNQLAAGGFRDVTRIASSDPSMWTDILLSNRENLLQQLNQWQEQMTVIQQFVEEKDERAIFQFFAEGKRMRDALPMEQAGAIPAFHDLLVTIPDYPGIIAEITQLLADNQLSITNVKIIENREDIYGTMQLTFKSERDRLKGKECIEAASAYTCTIA